MNKKLLLSIFALLSSIAAISINAIAVILPLNNRSPEAISDSFNAALIPANFVFYIWGLIYIGLLAFPIYQIFIRKNEDFTQLNYLFILSNIANGAWIVLWHYGHYTWSFIVMVILLLSLILSYVKLNIGKEEVDKLKLIMVNYFFSLYLGWITVATIANAQATLIARGFDGLGMSAEIWAVFLIFLIMLISFMFLYYRKDVIYIAVILWALFGVFIKMEIKIIGYFALIAFIILLLSTVYVKYKDMLMFLLNKTKSN